MERVCVGYCTAGSNPALSVTFLFMFLKFFNENHLITGCNDNGSICEVFRETLQHGIFIFWRYGIYVIK